MVVLAIRLWLFVSFIIKVNWGVSEIDWPIMTIRVQQIRVIMDDTWCEGWWMITENKNGNTLR